jgi:hypothetical protein
MIGSRFTGEYEKTGHEPVTSQEREKIRAAFATQHTQGSSSSGNYGHEGRPTLVGGSAPGVGEPNLSIDKNGHLVSNETVLGEAEHYYGLLGVKADEVGSANKWPEAHISREDIRTKNAIATPYHVWQVYKGSSDEMNHYLKTGETRGGDPDLIQDYVNILSDEIDRAGISPPEGTELYRGVSIDTARDLDTKQIGDTCTDKGFQSFSTAVRVGDDFARMRSVPNEGLSRTVIRAVTTGNQKFLPGSAAERELIAKPGTSWKIVSKNVYTDKQTKINVVTVMPNE